MRVVKHAIHNRSYGDHHHHHKCVVETIYSSSMVTEFRKESLSSMATYYIIIGSIFYFTVW